jgi:hypothetical protein
MIKLPKKLQNKSFRFIKIRKGEKAPLEEDWPMTNNYKYNDPEFIEYLKTAKAYGVACGFGKLAIVDCDNKKSAGQIENSLPDTFTVVTPGHKSPHLYFIVKDLTAKIVMTDDKNVHHGEVQFTGFQALGPNSLHPSGKEYKIVKDIPIEHITKKELLAAIEPFVKEKKEKKPCESGIQMDISIVSKDIRGLNPSSNGELQGPHPVHPSEGGTNFSVNEETNRWHCWRCPAGGDAISLIALLEELAPCDKFVKGYFSTDEGKEIFKKALAIAKKKYGYKDEKTLEKEKQAILARPLEEEEIAELRKPELIFNILKEIQLEGVVGEEKSILALINRIAMRCVINITKTSGNIIVLDETGLGKDNVTEKLCRIMLIKNKTLYSASAISDKVLNYWHPGMKDSSWDGRVMYLQDPEEDTLKGQAFRVRASGDNENVTLDTERNVRYIQIVGKPILIVTSMKTGLDIELIRRWDSVHLDPSKELTRAIIKYQLRSAAGKEEIVVNSVLREALRNLPRVKVIIPFSEELESIIYTDNTIMRTQTLKFLDIIKSSAALHQFQRKLNDEGAVLASKEDLAYALFVVKHCAIFEGQVLNRQQETLISYLEEKKVSISFKQIIADNPGMSEAWVYRQEKDLVERRLLQMTKEYDTASGRDVKCFKIDTYYDLSIKIPDALPGYFFNQLEKDINESRKKRGLKSINLYEGK